MSQWAPMIDQHFHHKECNSWKIRQLLNCSPDPPAAPSRLASLQQGGGDLWLCWHVTPGPYWSPTSSPDPIGRHSARKGNRDSGAS